MAVVVSSVIPAQLARGTAGGDTVTDVNIGAVPRQQTP
jgi:hypothetical protein